MATDKPAKPVKLASVASIVREAGASANAFLTVCADVLDNESDERIVEIYGRLSVPKGFTAEEQPEVDLDAVSIVPTDFEHEAVLAESLNTVMDRHHRKLKWNCTHPAVETLPIVIDIYNVMGWLSQLRVRRVIKLVNSKDVMTPYEWGVTRDQVNRSYRDFRIATRLMATRWIDSMLESCDRTEVRQGVEGLPRMFKARLEELSLLRDEFEIRRAEMGVQPPGRPVVKPPRYFGGDLLDDGAWQIFLGDVQTSTETLLTSLDG